jgi:hypothetical protein
VKTPWVFSLDFAPAAQMMYGFAVMMLRRERK